MRTHTPTPDSLPDNVAIRLFRLAHNRETA
nr:MAG TPA: hypothetical protein [Caudoviricetes sp.]